MRSEENLRLTLRPMVGKDRPGIEAIVSAVGNFNPSEVRCVPELVDIALGDPAQKDYRFLVAEDTCGAIRAYACWGPSPMTRGTFDLYWIATHPGAQGQGLGRALMEPVEEAVRREDGRLLVVETSSKESYGKTVRFYRRMGYEEASRIRDFYDAGDDKIVFVKRFSR